MRNASSFRSLAGLLFVLGMNGGLLAQSAPTESPTYAVRVAGLTSEERDAVARDLASTGHARMVFACVPAGVMVFGPAPDRNPGAARTHALNVLGTRTQRQRITEVTLSLADAETACSEARDR